MKNPSPPKINNRKDVLLLLLYSPGKSGKVNESIKGRTRLMKMLFMFREEVLPHFSRGTEITGDNFYEFFPWDFGPFSSQVYDDLSFFILRGFVKNSLSQEEATLEAAAEWQKWVAGGPSDEANEAVSEFQEEEFTLAERGVSFTKKLYDQLTDNQKRLLLEFKSKMCGAPLRAILRYVYKAYPKLTTNSKIKEEVLGNYLG